MIPKTSDEDLKKFVRGYCDGHIFTSGELQDPKLLEMVFMPLISEEGAEILKEEIDDVGLIWEWISKAGPRAVNGYPTFTSFNVMNMEDAKRAAKAIKKELQRRNEMEL